MTAKRSSSMGMATTTSAAVVLRGLLLLMLSCSLFYHVDSFSPLSSHSQRSRRSLVKLHAKSPQLLKFREPKTNVTVVLVGAMHYNPTSVRLANDTIRELGLKNQLGSVVIESCDLRWNKTADSINKSPLVEKVLTNEMRTATEAAFAFDRPVVLGDQRINITGQQLGNGLKQTFMDLATPFNGGWKRFYSDLVQAADLALPSGQGYLDASNFFSPQLMLAAPVSLIKYPLSYLARNPIATTVVFSTLFSLNALGDATSPEELELTDLWWSLFFSFMETVVFSRLLIKELLAERNEILARNILEQCKIYEQRGTSNNILFGWNSKQQQSWFGIRLPWSTTIPTVKTSSAGEADAAATDYSIIYAPNDGKDKHGNPILSMRQEETSSSADEEKVVVAVLGMAHCNGIKKLLKEQMV